ncbi:hypothetical protein [Solidesulfovibrio fructosivorans]|uniref:hypothetical protein n=1 Tax=Solidesulfovibrio fructosivorans TaxID=878 RepID=UPI0005C1A5FF|nr:hypothetical protein [Solidesulfovibrio fructosivorans]
MQTVGILPPGNGFPGQFLDGGGHVLYGMAEESLPGIAGGGAVEQAVELGCGCFRRRTEKIPIAPGTCKK